MNARRAQKERELHDVIAKLSETSGLPRNLLLRLSEKVAAVCDEHWVALERVQEQVDKVELRLERSDGENDVLRQQLACKDYEAKKLQIELARCQMEKEQLQHQFERTKNDRDTWRARAEMLEKERLPVRPSRDLKSRGTKRRRREPMNGEESRTLPRKKSSPCQEDEIQEVRQSSQQSVVQVAPGIPTPSADSSAVESWLRRPTPSKKTLEPATPPPLPTVRELDESLRARAQTRRRSKLSKLELPCERCKREKRKRMEELAKRKNKKVNEKVWERWIHTPGNCLEYMHADQPVPNRDKEYDLSFSESETQSPSERDVQHESGVRIDTYGNTVDSEP